MEVEKNYASRGLAGTALGLAAGSAGVLGTQLLANGVGGLLGGKAACGCGPEGHMVDRYALEKEQHISEMQSQLMLKDAIIDQDKKTLEVYRYIDGKMEGVNAQLCQQAVINAQLNATINCLQNQMNVFSGLTKVVIPSTNVCTQTTTAGA